MSNLTTALIIVMSINVVLFLGQAAMIEINPAGSTTLITSCKGTVLGTFDKNGCTNTTNYEIDATNVSRAIPRTSKSVDATNGNFFTDAISSIIDWMADGLGIGYVLDILAAPYNFLKVLHLPNVFVFAVGGLWYGVTLLLIIGFIFQRDL